MKNILALLALMWFVVPRVEADTEWAYPKFDPHHPPTGNGPGCPEIGTG